jgi:CDP-diacylglycerol---glycerol-3-phosphate 3-phosphatidyltransferase
MGAIVNTANALSLLRIILTPLFVWFLFMGDNYIIISLFVFTIASITDSCDGYAARRLGIVSEFGNFFDPIADKVLTIGAFLAFWWLEIIPLWFVILILLRDGIVTWLRIYMIRAKFSFATSKIAKWKTFLQFVIIYLLFLNITIKTYVCTHFLQTIVEKITLLVIFGTVALMIYSIIDYFKKYLMFIRGKKYEEKDH